MSDAKDEKVVVSDAEIKKVEQELQNKTASKEKEMADKIRKELEVERKLKELEAQRAELEKKLADEAAQKEQLKQEQQRMLDAEIEKRLQEELTKRKAVVSAGNPSDQAKQAAQEQRSFEKYSEDQLRQVEYESEMAFRELHGIPKR